MHKSRHYSSWLETEILEERTTWGRLLMTGEIVTSRTKKKIRKTFATCWSHTRPTVAHLHVCVRAIWFFKKEPSTPGVNACQLCGTAISSIIQFSLKETKNKNKILKPFVLTGDCVLTEGARCQNGACLDHECHCNDGYGGCGCSTPGKKKR